MTKRISASTDQGTATDDPLAKVVRIGQLADLYGGLLTERQRTFVQLHYEEDLSFGEIARTYNVSRQAIHDAVKHAEASLEDYESKLHLLERGFTRTGVEEAGGAAVATAPEERGTGDTGRSGADEAASGDAVRRLRALEERLRRSGGIIYNAEGVVREIAEIAAALDAACKTGSG